MKGTSLLIHQNISFIYSPFNAEHGETEGNESSEAEENVSPVPHHFDCL